MSTLELENIKHPDNSGNNLTLAADGSLGATTFTGGALNVNNTSLTLKSQGESGPFMYRAGGAGNDVRFYAANGTIASPTAKTNGQNVGQIHFHPHDGTNYRQVGSILAYMAGNASTNNTPVGLKFYTGSTTNNLSMTINENGYVTTPNQPGFRASSTVGNISTGATVQYNIQDWGNGSHYSTGTSRFTAPVSGKYAIHFSVKGINIGSVYARIKKNGTQYGPALEFDNDISSAHTCMSFIGSMNVNDYIEVYAGSNVKVDTSDSFSVILIG